LINFGKAKEDNPLLPKPQIIEESLRVIALQARVKWNLTISLFFVRKSGAQRSSQTTK